MAEPMPDHQLALLGDMADTCRDGWSPEDWDPDGLDAFLDLILAAVAEIDRIRADLEAAKQTIKAQKADMSTWAVRWQEQFDRAERAETADPGPSQPTDCSSDAAADLRGAEEAPHSVCPHVVTDGATSHCALAERQVREVDQLRAQRDAVIEAVRAELDGLVKTRSSDARRAANRLLKAARKAEAS